MVCRIKNRHTFKSLPILNSAYFTECRFVIRHITQTDTETETEANFTHPKHPLLKKNLSLDLITKNHRTRSRLQRNTPLHLSREYTVFGPNAYTEAL